MFLNRFFSLLAISFPYGLMTTTALILSSCSHYLRPDFSPQQQLQTHLQQTYPGVSFTTKQTQLNDEPLTPQTAIQLMLSNSPKITAELTRLGMADAALWQASVISNPRLSFTLLGSGHNGWQWDVGLSQSLFELLTRSVREQEAKEDSAIVELEVLQVFHTEIASLQQQYFAAIAATQDQTHEQILLDAADAKAALAKSLFDAGNISELDYLARVNEAQEQERSFNQQKLYLGNALADLNLALGLHQSQPINLPKSLPLPVQEHLSQQELLDDAFKNRVEIQRSYHRFQQLDQQNTLIKKEYGIADSRVGIAAKKESSSGTSSGPQIELALPLFDQGQARLAQLAISIDKEKAELEQIKRQIEHDINLSIRQLEHARLEYSQVTNSLKTTERRLQLAGREVNFMLSSPFDLIDMKTRHTQLGLSQTQAALDYWQARSQLELAVGHAISLEANTSSAGKISSPLPTGTIPADSAPAEHIEAHHKEHTHD